MRLDCSRIRRLSALLRKKSFSESLTFMGIWLRLALVDIKLRSLPVQVIKSWLYHRVAVDNLPLSYALTQKVMQLEQSVMQASAHPVFFNMSCLRRALVMRSILATWGIPSQLCFGARMPTEGDQLEAHAWLDLGVFCLGQNESSTQSEFISFTR